jgi:hypothetical protein
MNDCPTCEYNKKRAQIWRDEAYRLAGHPLPERDPVLEEREACAKEADKRLHDYTMLTSNPPQSGAAWSIASAIRARGQA